jgi:hypothetical protein
MSIRSDASAPDVDFSEDEWSELLGDDAVPTEDGDASAVADPASSSEGGSPPTQDEPDASPASTETSAVAGAEVPAEGATAETPAAPVAWQPPPGGSPFQFTVDGTPITPDGALQYPEGVWIPTEVWDRQIRPNYLANRQTWRAKEADYQRQIRQGQEVQSEKAARADALLAKVAEIDKGGPEAWAAWLDEFHQNRPILEAQIRAQLAESRAQAFEAAEQERRAEAEAEALVPQLRQHLDSTLKTYLARDEFKVLASEAERLLGALWEDHAARLFFEADRDYPEYGLARGQPAFRYDEFQRLLEREAAVARQWSEKVKAVEAAAKRNAAAVSPAKPVSSVKSAPAPTASPSAPVRDEQGRFTSARAWKDSVLDDDWEDVFSES